MGCSLDWQGGAVDNERIYSSVVVGTVSVTEIEFEQSKSVIGR
jgi:hypothetical protein